MHRAILMNGGQKQTFDSPQPVLKATPARRGLTGRGTSKERNGRHSFGSEMSISRHRNQRVQGVRMVSCTELVQYRACCGWERLLVSKIRHADDATGLGEGGLLRDNETRADFEPGGRIPHDSAMFGRDGGKNRADNARL